MTVVLILILLTLWIIACTVCTVIGFYFGKKSIPKQAPRAAPPEPTEEEKRNAKKAEIETFNMMTYDGNPQEDIVV